MRSILALTTLLALSRVTMADAPDVDRGRQLFAEGQTLYTRGDYDGAAAKFELAYAKDPDPAYVFNLAQAHRLARNCARAAIDYRKFLELVLEPPNEAEVEIYIREMDDCTPKKPDPIVKNPIPQLPNPNSVTGSEGHSNRNVAGLALGISGVAVVAVAGFFTWDAKFLRDRRDSLQRSCAPTQACVGAELVDYDSRRGRAQTIAIASWATGGAALVAGAVMYLSRAGHEQPAVSITPAPGGMLVVGGGSF